MIDFRYHLVSIVAVFLALAVGIVLGAGPLKEDLGAALDDQVSQLRDDRNALRTELDAAQERTAMEDEYSTLTVPAVVEARLIDEPVAVVALPEAEEDLVARSADTLREAGTDVVSTTVLADSWNDPDEAISRNETAVRLAPEVGLEPSLASSEHLLNSVLAEALAGRTVPGQTGAWRGVLEELHGTGLIQYTRHAPTADQESDSPGQDNRAATSVVVVAGPMDPEAEGYAGRVASHLSLLSSLGISERPTLLVGAGVAVDGEPAGGALLTATREDGEAGAVVSTVDNTGTSIGQGTLILALVEEYAGATGHYGFADGADAVAPQPRERPVLAERGPTRGPTPDGGATSPTEPTEPDPTEADPTDPAPTTTDAP